MTRTRPPAPTGEGVSHPCRKHRRRPVADRRRVHAVLCAGLLVFMAGRLALAQPGAELEIGGGYHAALDLGGDWFTVPSTPTVDVRRRAQPCSSRWRGRGPARLLVDERAAAAARAANPPRPSTDRPGSDIPSVPRLYRTTWATSSVGAASKRRRAMTPESAGTRRTPASSTRGSSR